MDAKSIILKLKQTDYKALAKADIKRQIYQLPLSEQREIINKLREEKTRSDNSDIIDVINDIVNEFSPEK